MADLSMNEKTLLLQYAIGKCDSESVLKDKLKDTLSPKERAGDRHLEWNSEGT